MSSIGYVDEATGDRLLTDPEPFRYDRGFDDDVTHVVRLRDTTAFLAHTHYRGFVQPRPAQLGWIIEEYNAVFDPTLDLEESSKLIVPSIRTVHEQVFDRARPVKARL